MNKYRFKTEKEFIKEYGDNWRRENPIFWNTEMDYLLGTPFKITVIEGKIEYHIRRLGTIGDLWIISIHHLKKDTPTYNKRKFIYE